MIERYVQRFSQDSKLEIVVKIPTHARSFEQNKQIRLLKEEISEKFSEAKETKSHLNNTSALSYLYEKYGYDTVFHFFHNKTILFVARKLEPDENGEDVYKGITCYDLRKPNIFKNIQLGHNFRKHRHSKK
jgi:hypothetical protein